jgi:hypothetical protein
MRCANVSRLGSGTRRPVSGIAVGACEIKLTPALFHARDDGARSLRPREGTPDAAFQGRSNRAVAKATDLVEFLATFTNRMVNALRGRIEVFLADK